MSTLQEQRRAEMDAKNFIFMEGYYYALARISDSMILGHARRACVAMDFAGLYLENGHTDTAYTFSRDCLEAIWTEYAHRIGIGNWQSYADCQLVRFRQFVSR